MFDQFLRRNFSAMMEAIDISEARDGHHVYALLEAQMQRQTWEPHKQHPHEDQHSGEGPRENTWIFVDKCLASGYLDSISSKTGLLREGRQLTKGINGRVPPGLTFGLWNFIHLQNGSL
jgi:hypothetical protein